MCFVEEISVGLNSPVGATIVMPASQLQCPLALTGITIVTLASQLQCLKIFQFYKKLIFSQNHFILFIKLKRPKKIMLSKGTKSGFLGFFPQLILF